nr:PREDICTED: mediator of RNA polymerase II transcription subunit 33A-like isoform X2 [Daucus carota subsp. sativus]
MSVNLSPAIWESVLELTKTAEANQSDPTMWAIEVSTTLNSAGVALPSQELATLLVSHIFWDHNVSITWKFLEKALSFRIVPHVLLFALLSTRVIPNRRSQPAAFRLYMELLKRHVTELTSDIKSPNNQTIISTVDKVLQLSKLFDVPATEPGVFIVEFTFSIVCQLLEASIDDEGLLGFTPEKKFKWISEPHCMDLDSHDSFGVEKNAKHHKRLQSANTVMAIDLIGQFLQNKVTCTIIHLARKSMPANWKGFTQCIQVLVMKSSALRKSQVLTPEALIQLTSDTRKVTYQKRKTLCMENLHEVTTYGPLDSSAGLCHGTSYSSLWLPLDLVLEDAMDLSQVHVTSAIEILTGSLKTLRAFNGTTWKDSFLGLWMAALRLVQRERNPIEGPVPHLGTRLSMLLSIVPLVLAHLIKEEEIALDAQMDCSIGKEQFRGKRSRDLVFCLQSLGDYQALLNPPESVVSAANQAAAKAMMFVSGIKVEETTINCSGNLHHLVVEACITRNLLDTSAYLWPGYVKGPSEQICLSVPAQASGWSSFMKGSPLTPTVINALVSSPASSLTELEKIYEIAVQGSDDDKITAATILCGASLVWGWNIQEHTVNFITRLLCPPVTTNYSGNESHLIRYAPMLNVILLAISSVDCIQIFFLHGVVPQLAGSLMPICEVFGSCLANVTWTLTTGEEISAYAIFSNAFAVLLMLWRFNSIPLEHGVGDVPRVGSQLTPEYLLILRNSHIVSSKSIWNDKNNRTPATDASSLLSQPVYVASFPKLKVWYRQHLACIASPLSGLIHGTPVHQIVDELLCMMFKKITGGKQPVTSGCSASSVTGEGTCSGPNFAAWDVLEAVPYVVDAALTACSHGRLSPRELCTGLKNLADFLPASLATIVSYFSAEVSRGVWKDVMMNGVDWPSPAANLSTVEEQIKKILAATGVDIHSLDAGRNSPATLPLPLAAFVSLTITYKIDKASQHFLNLAGPALESLAAGCPWPCMPIVASLWAQKARRWSDFLVFSASRTVFLHNKDAVVQLLRSCFTATLDLKGTAISSNGGVGALLGHGFGYNSDGEIKPVAPGILYLRIYRSIRDIMSMREEIVAALMQSVSDIVCNGLPKHLRKPKKAKFGMRYGQISLATALTKSST